MNADQATQTTPQQVVSPYVVLAKDDQHGAPGRQYMLTGEDITIGSAPNAHIRLQGDAASPEEARIFYQRGHWHIKKLDNSLNLFVNGSLAMHHVFRRDAEVFQVGAAKFTFFAGNTHDAGYTQQLYQHSITDPLTGSYRRNVFEQHACEELERCLEGHPVSLIVIDLDRFHDINEKFGHLGGDAVLKRAVQCIRSQLRKDDILSRWGGEEFAILLPRTHLSQAAEIAERVRSTMQQTSVLFEGEEISATCSAGVTTATHRMTLAAFFQQADDRMLIAKTKGRNRVQSTDDV